MNFVIERYDTALRKVLAEIREKNAVMQRMSQREREFFSRVVNERDTVVAREAALKDEFAEKCKGMMDELKSSQEMVLKLKREKSVLEEEKAASVPRHSAEVGRLRDSWSFEVTRERIRVMVVMITSNRCFDNIRDRKTR